MYIRDREIIDDDQGKHFEYRRKFGLKERVKENTTFEERVLTAFHKIERM